jgi:pentatricopeptide repeat protein
MEAAGVQPNEVTFNTMIDGHCKANDVNGAERWFTKMEAAGVQPNVLTFNTLLKAVSWRGDLARCIQFFTLMVDSGLRPDGYTFVALFFTCSRASRRHPEWALEWALEWFRDFASRGLMLNQHVANAFERCVDEWTAQDLYRQHGLTVVQAGRKKGGRGKGGSGKGGKGGRGKGTQATNGGSGFYFTFSNHGRHQSRQEEARAPPRQSQETDQASNWRSAPREKPASRPEDTRPPRSEPGKFHIFSPDLPLPTCVTKRTERFV